MQTAAAAARAAAAALRTTTTVAAARHAAAAAACALDAAAAVDAAATAVASSALVATALRTTGVDDLQYRGGLRSQWLRHAKLTGGVRGRDARLDHQVDVVRRRQLREPPALLHQCRQQHPCHFFQHLLQVQHGRENRGLW